MKVPPWGSCHLPPSPLRLAEHGARLAPPLTALGVYPASPSMDGWLGLFPGQWPRLTLEDVESSIHWFVGQSTQDFHWEDRAPSRALCPTFTV